MRDLDTQTALREIAAHIGSAVSDLSFEIQLQGDGEMQVIRPHEVGLAVRQEDSAYAFEGEWNGVGLVWTFVPFNEGYTVSMALKNTSGLTCSSLTSLSFEYGPATDDLFAYRVPTLTLGVEGVGLHRVDHLDETNETGTMLRGAFGNGTDPGLFVGTHLPQKNLHLYTVRRSGEALRFECTTRFPEGPSQASRIASEATWVCATRNVRAAVDAYAEHLPMISPTRPPVGWNSWDYYFFTVSLDDVIENVEEILCDEKLAQAVDYIVVDEGWEHLNGDWFPNHKFPEGMERLAHEIYKLGYVPGVWTAPVMVNTTSRTALRNYDILIKDQFGDPAVIYGQYVVDPTHPKGEAFLRRLFSQLYEEGYRFFKVDYVDALLYAERFADPSKGHYEVLQDLFALIRECVTDESHILGCSLPYECGPGYADSMRAAIDIHNQWTHVEWIIDYLQLGYWWHERVAVTDPDFLIVRGSDTSLEAETNVLNPKAHNPNPPRWRRGPVFNLEEARTWATIVHLSGGSLFLSDRLGKLTAEGKALIYSVLEPTGVAARPLDLGDVARASLWLAQGDGVRLGIINWSDASQTRVIDLDVWGLPAADALSEFWTGDRLPVRNGKVNVDLAAHGSALLCWD